MCRPFCIERGSLSEVTVLGACAVGIVVLRTATIGLGEVTSEGVARTGGRSDRGHAYSIRCGDRRCGSAILVVKGYSACRGCCPLGIERGGCVQVTVLGT